MDSGSSRGERVMAEYIEREATITVLKNLLMQTALNSVGAGYGDYALCDIYEEIAQNRIKRWVEILPAADVQPVVHGKWVDMNTPTSCYFPRYKCSVCGGYGNASNYCSNCGARMDGGKDDNA